ncbi:MAG: hypothetical protein IID63_07575 [candidate division Zixibacteria bacterium]|nr:hypothetical protein [candidate division Zixibacteria bacterium]
MISRIRGKLAEINEDSALVENGGVFYEVKVPSALAERLKESGKVGQPITFETINFIEAGERKTYLYPRLVGFTDPIAREFFLLFTQVQGMGVKKALRSLIIPIKDIAAAIENRDSTKLCSLPGVGGRLADKIIAQLHGKTAKFALSREDEALAKSGNKVSTSFEEEALEVLLQLQYNQSEARRMIDSALSVKADISSSEELISFIFKNEMKSEPLRKGA